jgi:hypothetical protein
MRFTEIISENKKPGLWANIHAKRDRIKNGSGEHMRKPGSKGAPTADALRKSATDEAANPAQQAAIAVNMKKHHQKPKGVAEGQEQTPDQVRQTLNAWMNQDQQYEDPTERAPFQAKVWPYIQKNIQSILSDKGADGKGSYPAAPYAAWLLVQHMDAYPQNQGKFLQQLEQSGLDPADSPGESGKLQFLRDRYEVNKWIAANANNKKYYVNNKPLPNPTVNVRNPAIFKDAGQVATSRDGALKNAIAAGNKLLVDAVRATKAQTQPSYKQGVAEGENWSKHNNKRAGGMSKKSVSVYRREHPGSKIQTAVTTKPSKLKKGSKAAKRRASFCARMRGMKKHRTGAKTAHDPNSNINKSLRRWHCESIEELHELVMLAEQYIRNKKNEL